MQVYILQLWVYISQFRLVFTILHLYLAILKQFSQNWKKKKSKLCDEKLIKEYYCKEWPFFVFYSVVETSIHNIVIIFCVNRRLDVSLRIINKFFIWPRRERGEHAHEPDRALCVHEGARTTEDRERAGGRYELALSGCVWPVLNLSWSYHLCLFLTD